MSLGCGTPGGNITSDNISPMHLINIKRLAYERRPINRPEGRVVPVAVSEPVQRATISPALASPTAAPDRAEISHIVQKFLDAQAKASQGSARAEVRTAASNPTETAASKMADPKPVDFVSEDDVRRAIKKGERIYVGPRTIITPSARELGEAREIFVSAN